MNAARTCRSKTVQRLARNVTRTKNAPKTKKKKKIKKKNDVYVNVLDNSVRSRIYKYFNKSDHHPSVTRAGDSEWFPVGFSFLPSASAHPSTNARVEYPRGQYRTPNTIYINRTL
uniref:Uncharacterized protein n=1 Tax=Sipha flava TaxID=143950 RepID=A0A2S2QB43_9HEMI